MYDVVWTPPHLQVHQVILAICLVGERPTECLSDDPGNAMGRAIPEK